MNGPFNIGAGQIVEFFEPGDFFRLLVATDPVTVRYYRQGVEIAEAPEVVKGYAERFRIASFDRVQVQSATAQTLQIAIRLGNDVYNDLPPVGDTAIVSSVPLALDAPTLAALELQHRLPLSTGSWASTTTFVANTPLQIIAPGANVNGAIVQRAMAWDLYASQQNITLLAKASAPANITDGEVIAQSYLHGVFTNDLHVMNLDVPIRIAAGLGLYVISSFAGTANRLKSARYILL